jgi:hypothetical protein
MNLFQRIPIVINAAINLAGMALIIFNEVYN